MAESVKVESFFLNVVRAKTSTESVVAQLHICCSLAVKFLYLHTFAFCSALCRDCIFEKNKLAVFKNTHHNILPG